MVLESKRWNDKIPFVLAVQMLCLLILGIVESLNMTKGVFLPVSLNLLSNAGIAASLFGFWAVTLWKAPRSVLRRDVVLGLIMVFWFLIVEGNRRINYIPLQSLTIFISVYMIALPFAAITQDQDRQAGIRLVSGLYIATALFFVVLGIILFINGRFPGSLSDKIYWDGARLLIISHPNIISRIFMIGLAMCMGFFGLVRKVWAKILIMAAAILLFACIALTNTRAVVAVVCFILAGNVFFWVYGNKRKRFLLGVVAAAMAAVLFYSSSNALFQWNITRLVNQPAMQSVQEQTEEHAAEEDSSRIILLSKDAIIIPEKTPLDDRPKGNANSGQGTWEADLPTLNGRTDIWMAVFEKVWNEPAILLRGVVDTRLVMGNLHTHNAWLEALFVLGLPGLLLVLVFTWNAAWASLRLLWHSGVGMFQKNVALLTLASMVAALLEPTLFATYQEWSFSNFFFFLCLGYLTLWNRQIPRKK